MTFCLEETLQKLKLEFKTLFKYLLLIEVAALDSDKNVLGSHVKGVCYSMRYIREVPPVSKVCERGGILQRPLWLGGAAVLEGGRGSSSLIAPSLPWS